MPNKKWTELNKMAAEIERKKTLTTVRQVLSLIKAAAESATTFEDFTDVLVLAISKVDKMLEEE